MANEHAPAHSRIFKETILVTSPSKPVQMTPKGTPRRQVTLKQYTQEIEELYDAIKEASQTELSPPEEWTESATLEFVRATVNLAMNAAIRDEDDLFQYGCDRYVCFCLRLGDLTDVKVVFKRPESKTRSYTLSALLSNTPCIRFQ